MSEYTKAEPILATAQRELANAMNAVTPGNDHYIRWNAARVLTKAALALLAPQIQDLSGALECCDCAAALAVVDNDRYCGSDTKQAVETAKQKLGEAVKALNS